MDEKEKEEVTPVETDVVPTPSETPEVTADAPVETTEAPEGDAPQSVHALIELYRKENPENESLSDDEILTIALEEITGSRDKISRNDALNQKVKDVFDAYPVLVRVFQDLYQGSDLEEVIARHIDIDALQKVEGDPDFDKWDANKKARLAEREENEKLNKELDDNITASVADLEEFAAEEGMTSEAAIEWVNANVAPFLDQIAKLRVSKDVLKMVKAAISKESDVKEAEEMGIRKGRNEKIEAIKIDAKKTDLIPNLGGSATPIEPEKPAKRKGYIESLKERS